MLKNIGEKIGKSFKKQEYKYLKIITKYEKKSNFV